MNIVVYDSGVGGRLVFQSLEQYLSQNKITTQIHLHYFADSAHYPYGTKSEVELKEIVFDNLKVFQKVGFDCVALACNTASAVVENNWAERRDTISCLRTIVRPTVDVVNRNPEQYPAIFVIASQFTADNHIYQKAIHRVQPKIEIIEQANQVLINHIEMDLEKEIESEVAAIVAQVPDGFALLWGCTHFSFAKAIFYREMKKQSKNFKIIDPAEELTKAVIKYIEE
ncbi:MAG: aspartate/glutamate racemase family protein [Patescibacteria group bacterium]